MRGSLPGSALGMLQHVRVLDLSFPSNALKKDARLKVCIPALLSSIMPCLREIDLSNANVSDLALRHFAKKCPALEKVIWNNQDGILMWDVFKECNNLKEIYMDSSIFFLSDVGPMSIESERRADFILTICNASLERVSLKNAKFVYMPPQATLVVFVHRAPSLRWFRSDLSPEHIALLQVERPEVTFA